MPLHAFTNMLNIFKKNDPFEKRLLEFVSVFIAVMMTGVFLLDSGSSFQIQNMIMHVALIITGSTFYYLSSKEIIGIRTLYKPFLFILYCAVTFYWFSSTGIYGPTAAGAFSVITISFIFSKPYNRKIFLFGNFIYITVLSFGQILFPDVIKYGELLYENIGYEFTIVSYGLVLLLFFLKKEVDNERRTIQMKNQQLVHLNRSLKTTVEAQYKTLRELNNTQDQLMQSEKMASIGTLTAGLAHELNNPLNFVGGVVKPIKNDIEELKNYVNPDLKDKADYLSEEIFQLLDSVENGTFRASRVVEKILNFTPGRTDMNEFRDFSLSELLHDISRLVKKSNPDIQFEMDIQEDIEFSGNEIEINQVVLNLLRNSLQAIERNGRITITLGEQNEEISLTITDNGAGMTDHEMENAFSAFHTTKKGKGGTGLGLFLSQSIVKKHNGSIHLQSEKNNGTQVKVNFERNVLTNLNPN